MVLWMGVLSLFFVNKSMVISQRLMLQKLLISLELGCVASCLCITPCDNNDTDLTNIHIVVLRRRYILDSCRLNTISPDSIYTCMLSSTCVRMCFQWGGENEALPDTSVSGLCSMGIKDQACWKWWILYFIIILIIIYDIENIDFMLAGLILLGFMFPIYTSLVPTTEYRHCALHLYSAQLSHDRPQPPAASIHKIEAQPC